MPRSYWLPETATEDQRIMMSSGMDTRKIFVIGIALIFGISLDMLPSLYATLPYYLHPLFSSSLTFSTVLAVVLNQILRISSKPETIEN